MSASNAIYRPFFGSLPVNDNSLHGPPLTAMGEQVELERRIAIKMQDLLYGGGGEKRREEGDAPPYIYPTPPVGSLEFSRFFVVRGKDDVYLMLDAENILVSLF